MTFIWLYLYLLSPLRGKERRQETYNVNVVGNVYIYNNVTFHGYNAPPIGHVVCTERIQKAFSVFILFVWGKNVVIY